MILAVRTRSNPNRFYYECVTCGTKAITKEVYSNVYKMELPVEYCPHCDEEPTTFSFDSLK